MHRFVIRAIDNEVELGAYATLEEARVWAKRLAFANTCDVEIHDATAGTLVETRRNETEITLDAGQTEKWRANDPSVREHFQRQADQFECAIILLAADGERLDRLAPK